MRAGFAARASTTSNRCSAMSQRGSTSISIATWCGACSTITWRGGSTGGSSYGPCSASSIGVVRFSIRPALSRRPTRHRDLMQSDKSADIRAYWTTAAAHESDADGLRPTARDPNLQDAVEAAIESRLRPGDRVLDIGCGDG